METLEELKGTNILKEVETSLKKATGNTKVKILLSVNLIIGISLLLNAASQLYTKGNFAAPERDWIYFPLVIISMLSSAVYNAVLLIRKKQGNGFLNRFFKGFTVFLVTTITLSLLHTSNNPPLTILFDSWIAIVSIFIAGLVINRWVGLLVFVLHLINLIFAVNKIGMDFLYTSAWEFPTNESIVVLTIAVITYYLISFFTMFFEAGVIDVILKQIPGLIEKIKVATKRHQQLEGENERMSGELDAAKQIQEMVLPRKNEIQKSSSCIIATRMDAATEVGGDYFDILYNGNETYIGIGDVTDHGLQSGVVMIMTQTILRSLIEEGKKTLNECLHITNRLIHRNVHLRMQDQRNLTLLLAKINEDSISIAGQHESVLIRRKNGTIENISTVDLGMPIGLLEDLSENLKQKDVPLQSGDKVLFYTDGVTEAENSGGEEFSEDSLIESFKSYGEESPQEIINKIYLDIYNHIGEADLYDDITMVVLEKK